MTSDIRKIVQDLRTFYSFEGKVVIDMGAGGGQLVGYARGARKVIAVDRDAGALHRLAQCLRERGLGPTFELLNQDAREVNARGDVVLFEFCLHLMPEPERALAHALTLAPDVVVIDHAPGSPWSWLAAEERGVKAAWKAVSDHGVRLQSDFLTSQHFATYSELEAKVAGCGPEGLIRIQEHRWHTDMTIPMPYRIALCA